MASKGLKLNRGSRSDTLSPHEDYVLLTMSQANFERHGSPTHSRLLCPRSREKQLQERVSELGLGGLGGAGSEAGQMLVEHQT